MQAWQVQHPGPDVSRALRRVEMPVPRPGPGELLVEETGQQGRLIELLGVASHRDAASLGPEGYPIDWHGVRAFYRVHVAHPTAPIVLDAGGSTAESRWFTPAELAELACTEVTVEALRRAFP